MIYQGLFYLFKKLTIQNTQLFLVCSLYTNKQNTWKTQD